MYVCIYTTTGASYPPPSHGGGVGTRDTGPYILHYTSEMPRLSVGGMTERLRQVHGACLSVHAILEELANAESTSRPGPSLARVASAPKKSSGTLYKELNGSQKNCAFDTRHAIRFCVTNVTSSKCHRKHTAARTNSHNPIFIVTLLPRSECQLRPRDGEVLLKHSPRL